MRQPAFDLVRRKKRHMECTAMETSSGVWFEVYVFNANLCIRRTVLKTEM